MNCTQSAESESLITDDGVEELKLLSTVVYGYALPSVCFLGAVGNSLNLIILSRRKLRRSLRTLEQSANVCLIWLAVSDLCFCVTAFMTLFVPEDRLFASHSFMLYYTAYHTLVINVFIMSSTWLTVTMAIERYLAVCHPFRSVISLTLTRTKIVIGIVFTLSVVFNIPVIWRYQVSTVVCDNQTMYSVNSEPLHLASNLILDNTYRGLWAIIGNGIPLLLLVYCNIFLGLKIHRSYKKRKKFQDLRRDSRRSTETGSTLTVILVVIVVMFLILVAPSEMAMQVVRVTHNDYTITAQKIEVVTNFTQSINFSVNFLLYIIISPFFRRNFRQMLCYFRDRRRNRHRQYNGSVRTACTRM